MKDKGNMKICGRCYEDIIMILGKNGYDIKADIKQSRFNEPEAEMTFEKPESEDLLF